MAAEDFGPPQELLRKRRFTFDVHSLEKDGEPMICIEKTPTHYRLRLGGHDSTSRDRHSLHLTISSSKLHEITSSLSALFQTGDPVLIDLMSCKILFLHRDQPILGMNFQLFVSFAQMAAAQTWGYQAAPQSNLDLDEIVPDLLSGSEACGFTSFFICKKDLFFMRFVKALNAIKSSDPAAAELLSDFDNAFQDHGDDEAEGGEFDGDEDEDGEGEEEGDEDEGEGEEGGEDDGDENAEAGSVEGQEKSAENAES